MAYTNHRSTLVRRLKGGIRTTLEIQKAIDQLLYRAANSSAIVALTRCSILYTNGVELSKWAVTE